MRDILHAFIASRQPKRRRSEERQLWTYALHLLPDVCAVLSSTAGWLQFPNWSRDSLSCPESSCAATAPRNLKSENFIQSLLRLREFKFGSAVSIADCMLKPVLEPMLAKSQEPHSPGGTRVSGPVSRRIVRHVLRNPLRRIETGPDTRVPPGAIGRQETSKCHPDMMCSYPMNHVDRFYWNYVLRNVAWLAFRLTSACTIVSSHETDEPRRSGRYSQDGAFRGKRTDSSGCSSQASSTTLPRVFSL